MGSTYPTADSGEFMAWCRTHAPIFRERAAEIGLSPQLADAFEADFAAADAARVERDRLLAAYRAAVSEAELRTGDLARRASECVRTIRLFADQQGEGARVLALAEIGAPGPRRRAESSPPPMEPMGLSAELDAATRGIEVRWKSRNPRGTSGTSFVVRRRMVGADGSMLGEWEILGIVGGKRFRDDTLPLSLGGAMAALYTVQGIRGGRAGPVSRLLTVGIGGGGGRGTGTESEEERGAVKMAA